MKRVVIVTGGIRGIGAAISKKFASSGDVVIASYVQNEKAACAFTQQTGIESMSWDVQSYDACEEAIHAIEKRFGRIDVLVNNAGITRDVRLHKMRVEQWHQVIQTNLNALFNMCRPVIALMRERQFGRILNVSSINALKGQIGQTNYAAAKSGILGFTKSLALEVARDGITVNALAPGYTNTEMVRMVPEEILNDIVSNIPLRRLGTAEEMAEAAFFLTGEHASFITGETLNVNGGQYMH